ncbi:MAG: cupin domain-containing protein [Nitrospinota bacterium]
MKLGKKIRNIRLRRGRSIPEVAEASGLSRGFISQVENERSSPSISSLEKIAQALDVPLPYLLLKEEEEPRIIQRSKRHRVKLGEEGVSVEVLTPYGQNSLEMLYMRIPPGRVSSREHRTHEGKECHLVVEGNIQANYGGQIYNLEEGDSFIWDGSVPHRLRNTGRKTAVVIIALAPPSFFTA